jgi:hypothetical protein
VNSIYGAARVYKLTRTEFAQDGPVLHLNFSKEDLHGTRFRKSADASSSLNLTVTCSSLW